LYKGDAADVVRLSNLNVACNDTSAKRYNSRNPVSGLKPKQQTTNNKQQTTNNKQQITNNKQQTTNNK